MEIRFGQLGGEGSGRGGSGALFGAVGVVRQADDGQGTVNAGMGKPLVAEDGALHDQGVGAFGQVHHIRNVSRFELSGQDGGHKSGIGARTQHDHPGAAGICGLLQGRGDGPGVEAFQAGVAQLQYLRNAVLAQGFGVFGVDGQGYGFSPHLAGQGACVTGHFEGTLLEFSFFGFRIDKY